MPDDFSKRDLSSWPCQPNSTRASAHRIDKTVFPKLMDDLRQMVVRDVVGPSDLANQ